MSYIYGYYYHIGRRKPTAKVIILSRKMKVLNRVQKFNKGKNTLNNEDKRNIEKLFFQ